MDSEDEAWVTEQSKKMEITPLKFEEMLDRLEKGSGQQVRSEPRSYRRVVLCAAAASRDCLTAQVVTLPEAKMLLKEDDDLIITVFDYWLNKRLKCAVSASASVLCSSGRNSVTSANKWDQTVAFSKWKTR